MSEYPLSLNEYLSSVKEVIQFSFDEPVWVKAEITNLNIKGGHYYLELAEKDEETDKIIASCKATIWKFTAVKIVLKFKRESGIELSKDLNMLIKIKARFDPQYGFSVNVEEIDSSYTLGDIAKRYQQIVERLTKENLIHKNQSLPSPFDIKNVLVIAPLNAAGLGDFQKDADMLDQAGICHFVYHTATFQGNRAAQSIIDSLSSSLRQWAQDFDGPPDLIVIIRGGGAVNDLAYLNDYDLAALLCRRSVPIWVGIGHEKDRTILDEIAHRTFGTPSKVISGIRSLIQDRISEAIDNFQKIQLLSKNQISTYQNKNDQYIYSIEMLATNHMMSAKKNIDALKNNIHYFAQQQLKLTATHMQSLIRETLIQSPKHVLAKGYAIVRVNNHAISSVQQISDQPIEVELQDGLIQANAKQVILNE